MNGSIGLERCLSFINCQISPPPRTQAGRASGGKPRRVVTLSRQAGSGAHDIAGRLAEILQERAPQPTCPWTVFDRNLVEKVLEHHKLPASLGRFMREDRISEISDTMDELFGLHPSSWTLVHKVAETILHLAELGNVIVIGRGANLITRKLDYAFHVRLVGSPEKRLARIQDANHLTPQAAAALMKTEDEGRRRFMKKYFGEDIDSPLGYHLVINTDLVPCAEAAELIADAVLQRQPAPKPQRARA